MEYLRTADDRFRDLPGHNFAPHYIDAGELRMHYLDEGPRAAAPVVLLHGEPSWCYLYRKMVPILAAAGHRVIAPDLIGFGRSDKPVKREDYTYQRHVDWMAGFVRALDLSNITLFGQDWGGLIGLRVLAGSRSALRELSSPTQACPPATIHRAKASCAGASSRRARPTFMWAES